jgi:Ohr subfamily peroxiredoxin
MPSLYCAEATAYGARTGTVVTSDGRLDLQLSRPQEMGGDGGPGTNPEQLFAAGFSACFHSAMRYAVRELGLPRNALDGSSVTARVQFLKEGTTDFGLAVELVGHLPELEIAQAEKLMAATHRICPYSKATMDNIEVRLMVREETPVP